jgi:hypothetical protein
MKEDQNIRVEGNPYTDKIQIITKDVFDKDVVVMYLNKADALTLAEALVFEINRVLVRSN